MPYKPKRPCRYPGCPALSDGVYCEAHRKWDSRETAARRGYDGKWREARAQFLRAHPLCEECQKLGKLTPARVVDHVIAHRGDQRLMWDRTNWRALCKECHDKKTGSEDSRPVYGYNATK